MTNRLTAAPASPLASKKSHEISRTQKSALVALFFTRGKEPEMSQSDYRKTWERYSQSWTCAKLPERVELFKSSLDSDCRYSDPLTATQGWDALVAYMEDFQRLIPGAYFEVVDFQSHHNTSLARWDMKSADGAKIGDGHSFGEYNSDGRLVKMTGFFEPAR